MKEELGDNLEKSERYQSKLSTESETDALERWTNEGGATPKRIFLRNACDNRD
ncbi:MAG: hypothetical protein H7249_07620 [Chitinophagaceae bacterium]|nr:hypothetical protein [Oligoflexus sp.]